LPSVMQPGSRAKPAARQMELKIALLFGMRTFLSLSRVIIYQG
jgi:hypothetical protein